ncbi:MAG TPA: hypothetical protein VGL97_20150 [Bryobacteraceae bacterium]|jgi:hypothetical protein
MPCPYFEPTRVAAEPGHATARLPLIDEYDGVCRAASEAIEVPAELRFRCCNHGNSRGLCRHFPADEIRSSLRYEVLRQTAATLDLLWVEEREYAPLAWRQVKYFVDRDCLESETGDLCKQAQILAFCRSYLARFPG